MVFVVDFVAFFAFAITGFGVVVSPFVAFSVVSSAVFCLIVFDFVVDGFVVDAFAVVVVVSFKVDDFVVGSFAIVASVVVGIVVICFGIVSVVVAIVVTSVLVVGLLVVGIAVVDFAVVDFVFGSVFVDFVVVASGVVGFALVDFAVLAVIFCRGSVNMEFVICVDEESLASSSWFSFSSAATCNRVLLPKRRLASGWFWKNLRTTLSNSAKVMICVCVVFSLDDMKGNFPRLKVMKITAFNCSLILNEFFQAQSPNICTKFLQCSCLKTQIFE